MKQKTFFFPSPKNKTRLLKEKDNEKSPAQQSSTLKRNFKIILTVSKAQGFIFIRNLVRRPLNYMRCLGGSPPQGIMTVFAAKTNVAWGV